MPAVHPIHRHHASSPRGGPVARGERGAILVQTAVMMIGLTAFSAFIVDYGILWTARRQVQNAADAAALAAAISLGFDVPGDVARARENAHIAVDQNPVWGAAANVDDGDITFPPCPAGSVAGPSSVCVRVEAYRNQDRANPLPTIFARLVGVDAQGVRASATAQVLYGSSTNCVKPFAIPDKWDELRGDVGGPLWDPPDTFARYVPGILPLTLLTPPPVDSYTPGGLGSNGTGFSRGDPDDYGLQVRFAPTPTLGPATLAGNQEFLPLLVTLGGSYDTDITSCSPRIVSPGDTIQVTDNPSVASATGPGVSALIAADGSAEWLDSLNGGNGGVSGGCMASGGCAVSPRIIALPVFNPDTWDARPPGVLEVVEVSRIVGFFIERYEPPHIVGRLMVYPVEPGCRMAAVPYDCGTMTADPQSAFVISVTLVR